MGRIMLPLEKTDDTKHRFEKIGMGDWIRRWALGYEDPNYLRWKYNPAPFEHQHQGHPITVDLKHVERRCLRNYSLLWSLQGLLSMLEFSILQCESFQACTYRITNIASSGAWFYPVTQLKLTRFPDYVFLHSVPALTHFINQTAPTSPTPFCGYLYTAGQLTVTPKFQCANKQGLCQLWGCVFLPATVGMDVLDHLCHE